MPSAGLAEQIGTAATPSAGMNLAPGRPHSWIWLLPALAVLPFSNGTLAVPIAAWLAPVFLLRFVRTQRPVIGLPVAYVVLAATACFHFGGLMPVPGNLVYFFSALFALVGFLPYVADRLLTPRLGELTGTLVFPATWVTLEFVASLSPGATWGLTPYSQYGNLPLLQLLSITGLWGITFLIGWFASVINLVWQDGLSSGTARAAAYLLGGSLAAVFLGGQARLMLFPPSSRTVRVAGISGEQLDSKLSKGAWQNLLQNKLTDEDVTEIRQWTDTINNDLFKHSQREAAAGARIILWGEENGRMLIQDEPAFLERGRHVMGRGCYLALTYVVWNPGRPKPRDNKTTLVKPFGEIGWEYRKSYPVPGGEDLTKAGDGKLPILDSPYGRLSTAICFDADFPRLIAQAGAAGVDILLVPSGDWKAIDPLHTRMASFRAIEQGVNLVRQTTDGLSAAYDYQGHVLAAMDHFQATNHTMVAQVPTKGVRTIYSRIGDLCAWLCIGTLLGLILQIRWRSEAAKTDN